MTVREFWKIMDEARSELTEKDMGREMHLYVSDAQWQHDMQSGRDGVTPRLIYLDISGDTITVTGG